MDSTQYNVYKYTHLHTYRTRQPKRDSSTKNVFELEIGARWLEGTSDGTSLCVVCGHAFLFHSRVEWDGYRSTVMNAPMLFRDELRCWSFLPPLSAKRPRVRYDGFGHIPE